MALTKDQILGLDDLPLFEVKVPEWGDEASVFVRMLTSGERDELEALSTVQKGDKVELNMKNARARIAAFTLCNEDGSRMFTTEEIDALGRKSAKAIKRIADAAYEFNGLSAKARAAAAKN